jgi:hypothetical protein
MKSLFLLVSLFASSANAFAIENKACEAKAIALATAANNVDFPESPAKDGGIGDHGIRTHVKGEVYWTYTVGLDTGRKMDANYNVKVVESGTQCYLTTISPIYN